MTFDSFDNKFNIENVLTYLTLAQQDILLPIIVYQNY